MAFYEKKPRIFANKTLKLFICASFLSSLFDYLFVCINRTVPNVLALFHLKNGHRKRLFSTNQMAGNSKTVSLLKKIRSLSKETIFEFSEQRDCF